MNHYTDNFEPSESEQIRQEIKETKKKLQELEHELHLYQQELQELEHERHLAQQAEYENKYGRINFADALKKVMK
jgi:septal ring factor EnvC (AmiA/AmiB activator)